ncbi:MAG: FUSC family protein [Acidimicrobiales bacterium]
MGAELGRFDKRATRLGAGARVGAAVGMALVIGLVWQNPGAAAAMGAGALLVGATTVIGGPRPTPWLLAVVTVAMGISTFTGSAAGHIGWLHTGLLVPWCLLGGLLMATGTPTASVGTQAIAAMVVFGRFAEPAAAAAGLAGYVMAGGAIAVLATSVPRSPTTFLGRRQLVAEACRELGALAAPRPTPRSGQRSPEFLEAAVNSLATADRAGLEELGALRSLLDVARRCRLELLVIDGLVNRPRPSRPELAGRADEVLQSFSAVLLSVAGRLGRPRNFEEEGLQALTDNGAWLLSRLRPTTADSGQRTPDDPDARALVARLDAVGGQVRAIVEIASSAEGPAVSARLVLAATHLPRPSARLKGGFETLRTELDLDSSVARHALRLTIVVVVAEAIGHASGLPHGYWIALTASVVLRPDFSVTIARGMARTLGTVIGVVLATLFAVAIAPSHVAIGLSAMVLCTAACAVFRASYLAFSAFLTALVVVLLDVVVPSTVPVALDRLADTAIGGGLAMCAYALWPSWSKTDAWASLAALCRELRGYLVAVSAAVARGDPHTDGALRPLAANTRRARGMAEAAVGLSLAEPEGRRIEAIVSEGVLAALRRVTVVAHALRTTLVSTRETDGFPEVADLASGAQGALEIVETALLGRATGGDDKGPSPSPPPRSPSLRALHGVLVGRVHARDGADLLIAETDELVDAIDTAEELLEIGSRDDPLPGAGHG